MALESEVLVPARDWTGMSALGGARQLVFGFDEYRLPAWRAADSQLLAVIELKGGLQHSRSIQLALGSF
jgi:hypothetical protein